MTTGLRKALGNVSHDPSMNVGLWHDVYLPRFRSGTEDKEKAGEALREHLERFKGMLVPDGYASACRAREALLRRLRGGVEGGVTRCFTATVEGRVVVGLGVGAVTESNIALLRAWGVPYLPGSALKGLASSAAHRSGGDAWKRAGEGTDGGVDAGVLFGSTAWQGVVTFHDAWWDPEGASKLPLDLDVMTVHHQDYYGDGKTPPADWDEPNPVPFVTAQGRYVVALSGPAAWVDVARAWLELALRRDGLGAKTHAGYGRMSLTERLSEDERAARRAAEAVANLPAQHKGAGTARQHVAALADALSKGADRQRLEATARALYEKEPKFWRQWAKAVDRTEAERATVAVLRMLPEDVLPVPVPAPVPVGAPPPPTLDAPREERGWLDGGAWIVGLGKKAMLHVRVGAETHTREAQAIGLKEELRTALAAASDASPVAVVVQLKDGRKLVALRKA